MQVMPGQLGEIATNNPNNGIFPSDASNQMRLDSGGFAMQGQVPTQLSPTSGFNS